MTPSVLTSTGFQPFGPLAYDSNDFAADIADFVESPERAPTNGGTAWTCKHEQWLRRQRCEDRHLKAAFDHGFDAVLAATAARDRLDEQILEVAASPRFADPVNRLGCLRGISALTGLALTVEIGDWTRFT